MFMAEVIFYTQFYIYKSVNYTVMFVSLLFVHLHNTSKSFVIQE